MFDIDKNTTNLIGKYAILVNEFGIGSNEVNSFVEKNKKCKKFLDIIPVVNLMRTKIDNYYKSSCSQIKVNL